MKCLNCDKDLIGHQTKYCSNQCQAEYQYKEFINRWKTGEEDGLRGQFDTSKYIKRYMFEKAKGKCEQCGWGQINPYTQKIPLELHHKDGDYRNNNEENLQLLCPNCHSLTETYRGGNTGKSTRQGREKYVARKNYCIDCGIQIKSTSTRCHECESKHRITEKPITRDELKELIRYMPFTQIGQKFGVSDNAIRKWCIGYGLPSSKKEIKKYSDSDWELL